MDLFKSLTITMITMVIMTIMITVIIVIAMATVIIVDHNLVEAVSTLLWTMRGGDRTGRRAGAASQTEKNPQKSGKSV